ncbi:MAG TPA: hypothetical protein VJR92_06060 [Gemmatimonadaceae bacterium]|nr:hypothetical protein [Gemmatimonadaceae bacterium]
MNTKRIGAVLLALLAACAPPNQTPARTGGPPPARAYIAPTRSEAECGEVRARAALFGEADTVGVQHVAITQLEIAPLPAPPELVGKLLTVRYRVDHKGAAMPDSINIQGAEGHPYEARLRASVRRYKHRPAVFEGCAVSARNITMVRLGPTLRR